MANQFGTLGTQFFDNAGDPLLYGLLYFFESGTTTQKTTYKDPALTIPNTHPVELDASGRLQYDIWFDGVVKGVLADQDDVNIQTKDPIGINAAAGAFSDWDSVTIYGLSDIVTGSDGAFYISITSANQNNDPTTSVANWARFELLKIWNTNETYVTNAPIIGSDGVIYTSIAGGNTGNNPVSTSGFWRDIAPAVLSNKTLVDATFQGSITEETFTLTGSDLDPTNGTIQTKTATGNITFTDSLSDGQSLTLRLIDGDLHTIVFPAAVWLGGAAPSGFTGDDMYEFIKTGGDLIGFALEGIA